MGNAPVCGAQGDRTTVRARGHELHVWRQPEPCAMPYGWHVVAERECSSVDSGEAATEAAAWDAAFAVLLEVERLAEARAESERRDRLDFGKDTALLAINPEIGKALPDLPERLEGLYRCAYGLDAILLLLRVADLRREQFEAGNDLEILHRYTACGLGYAAEVLTHTIMRGVEALSGMEVRRG
jgi:hypothetical protein